MSKSVNQVTLIGNIGKDPEIRTLDNGVKVATFSLATSTEGSRNRTVQMYLKRPHGIILYVGEGLPI